MHSNMSVTQFGSGSCTKWVIYPSRLPPTANANFPEMVYPRDTRIDAPAAVYAPVFDWSTTPLARDYKGHYMKVLDDVFTPDECDALIALAESDQTWKQAALHYGLKPHETYINTDYRNSERILRFDHEAANRLYERLLPYVQELLEIKPGGEWEGVVGIPGRVEGVWKLIGYVMLIP